MTAGSLTVEIGHVPIRLASIDGDYVRALERRFSGFLTTTVPHLSLDIALREPTTADPDDELRVRRLGTRWTITRSDCEAEVDLASGHGRLTQPAHPYATDTILRVVHSLLLAPAGGLLLHASSVIRHGRAYVFFGRSGAGKSTLVSLAPPDVTVLSEEMSYVRYAGDTYFGCGTPFTGELNRRGENVDAPLAGAFLLTQGDEDRIDALSPADAVRSLLQCVVCFEGDPTVTTQAFAAACDLAARVPMARLVFRRHPDVWRLIP